MNFDQTESSRTQGAPVTLYRFTHQDQIFCYTDAEHSISFNGDTYTPSPADRTSVATSGTLDKATVTINFPDDNDVVELFRVYPPSDVVTVALFQGHPEQGVDFKAVWSGRVLGSSRAGHTASLLAEPVSTSMRRPGLRRRWQYGCPHVLYGPQCRANRASFTTSGVVSGTYQNSIGLNAGWNGGFDKANFVDGIVQWTPSGGRAQLRTILQVRTDVDILAVTGQLVGLLVGQTISISLGCNHQMSGCNTFSNIVNYGGQPWIPLKNPVGFVNQYY